MNNLYVLVPLWQAIVIVSVLRLIGAAFIPRLAFAGFRFWSGVLAAQLLVVAYLAILVPQTREHTVAMTGIASILLVAWQAVGRNVRRTRIAGEKKAEFEGVKDQWAAHPLG